MITTSERAWRVVIGVMGSSICGKEVADLARDVGRRIAERGAVLLCGGGGGVMTAAAEGAREGGGLTVGVLPGRSTQETPPNPFIDIALPTGLGEGRNYVNVCASDVLIAIDGSWGTLSEIALAKRVGRPIVLLRSWALDAEVLRAETPEEAVELAFRMVGAKDPTNSEKRTP